MYNSAPNRGEKNMRRLVMIALGAILVSAPTAAQVQPFPSTALGHEIVTNGATIHVRVGGKGPAAVLFHRYRETGRILAPLPAVLVPATTLSVSPPPRAGASSPPPPRITQQSPADAIPSAPA